MCSSKRSKIGETAGQDLCKSFAAALTKRKAAACSMPLSMPSFVKSFARLSYCEQAGKNVTNQWSELMLPEDASFYPATESHSLELEVDGVGLQRIKRTC